MASPRQDFDATQPFTTRESAAKWFGLVGPLLAAFFQQQLAYYLVPTACARHLPGIVHLPALLALGVTVLAARSAWRRLREVGASAPSERDIRTASSWFFGLAGLAVSSFATAVIVALWLPNLFLDPCQV
jgi:hypothetical protein